LIGEFGIHQCGQFVAAEDGEHVPRHVEQHRDLDATQLRTKPAIRRPPGTEGHHQQCERGEERVGPDAGQRQTHQKRDEQQDDGPQRAAQTNDDQRHGDGDGQGRSGESARESGACNGGGRGDAQERREDEADRPLRPAAGFRFTRG
jgi:hypothetical protein